MSAQPIEPANRIYGHLKSHSRIPG